MVDHEEAFGPEHRTIEVHLHGPAVMPVTDLGGEFPPIEIAGEGI